MANEHLLCLNEPVTLKVLLGERALLEQGKKEAWTH